MASAPMTMRRISVERTSVTYQVQNAESDPVHLWCNLNVSEFACVFLLPGEHAERYEQVYGATLAGFARLGLEVTCFGLVPHRFDDQPERDHLELYVVRNLAPDFLFDAGARVQLAQSLWSDLRTFLVCAARARQAAAADPEQA